MATLADMCPFPNSIKQTLTLPSCSLLRIASHTTQMSLTLGSPPIPQYLSVLIRLASRQTYMSIVSHCHMVPRSTKNSNLIIALACIDQNQFCNPNNGACTALASVTATSKNIRDIGLNDVQATTAGRHFAALSFMTMTGVTQGRGAASLRAQESVYELTSPALPDNQWMIELDSWFATALATLQNLVVQFAAGPPSLVNNGQGYVNHVNATDKAGLSACRNQKVRGQSMFQSFSVVGVAFIIAVTLLLSIVNFVLPYAVMLARKVFTKGKWKDEQWRLYDKLQMQRMVFEARGEGTWKGKDDAVPVAGLADKFVMMDNEGNRGHAMPTEEGAVGQGAPEEYGLMGPEWKPVVRASVDEISYRR